MRDKRFIAVHRGGPLEIKRHRLLAKWSADCAEYVIHYFTEISNDDRPLKAIQLAREWASGKITTGVCMKAAVAAHAAARSVKNPAAVAAARTAGHAVATAHFAEHSLGPVVYGQKAAIAAGDSPEKVLAWQIRKLPKDVKKMVLSALENKRFQVKVPLEYSKKRLKPKPSIKKNK